jgi:hypothetical protein
LKNIGKTTGKAAAALTLLFTVAVIVFGVHFGGETKAAEKYFDAIERKDQTAFDKFSEKTANVNDIRADIIKQSGILSMEKTLKAAAEEKDNSKGEANKPAETAGNTTPAETDINEADVDFKVEFPSGATIKQSGDDYKLPIKLTVYNDYDHVVFDEATAHMTYIGRRWRVFAIDLNR